MNTLTYKKIFKMDIEEVIEVIREDATNEEIEEIKELLKDVIEEKDYYHIYKKSRKLYIHIKNNYINDRHFGEMIYFILVDMRTNIIEFQEAKKLI